MTPSRVWYVNVFVSDFERAVDFYRSTLGLPLQTQDDSFGYASFDTEGATLAVSRVDHEAEGFAELVGRHTGVGFGVEDLAKEHAQLIEKGVTFTMGPTEQPWGGFMAMFVDPDGNVFYLDQLRED